jgi:N-methylhydantoinase A
MHALNVGSMVGVGGVVVPRNPGAFSAVGLVDSDVKYDFFQLVDVDTETLQAHDLEESFAELISAARLRLAGVGASDHRFTRIGRFRYAWQDNDVEVVIGEKPLDHAALCAAIGEFHHKHQFQFGHSDHNERVELVSIGIEAIGLLERMPAPNSAQPTAVDASPTSHRLVYFKGRGWTETPVYERSRLCAGATFVGPAVVEEREATTVVIPGVHGRVDRDGNLVLDYLTKGDVR